MKTMFDLQQLLKKYHLFIYTGDKLGDMDLMEMELRELYEMGMIDVNTFQQGIVLIKSEVRRLLEEK